MQHPHFQLSKSAASVSRFVPGERLQLAVAARGVARLTLADLSAIRAKPPASFPAKLTPQFLKHSDEQTLASLVALHAAMSDFGMTGQDFSSWGVVSLSCYLGRCAVAGVIDKYKIDGPWGVSVQVIPHRTPHAAAGTISMGLRMHGPCIGVNGGPGGDTTALLSLASVFQQPQIRGAWFICSGWRPELTVGPGGEPVSDSVCQAVALGIVRDGSAAALGHIHCGMESGFEVDGSNATTGDELSTSLLDFLATPTNTGRPWSCHPSEWLRIDVELPRTAGAKI